MLGGVGSRTKELYDAEQPEKGMLYMAYPDQDVPGDGGVRLVELIIANHVVGLPNLQKINLLVNPNSAIPEFLGNSVNPSALLKRLGRLANAPDGMAESIDLSYGFQEPRSETQKKYGTAFGAFLLLQMVDPGSGKRFLMSTGDDLLYDKDGSSAISEFTEKLDASSLGATAGMQVAPIAPTEKRLYGAARSEVINDELYLFDMVEAPSSRDELDIPGKKIEIDKNISTYIVDEDLKAINEKIVDTPPPPENDGELQFTDSLRQYQEYTRGARLLVARASDQYQYNDIGQAKNVRSFRENEFRGLRSARKPVWDGRSLVA